MTWRKVARTLTNLPIIGVVFIVLIAATACEEQVVERPEPERPVLAMRVQDPSLLTGQWVPGRAKATQEVNLSFEVPGKIVDRPVFVGDEVTPGQLVAQLDPRDYENDLARAVAERDRSAAQFSRVEQAAKAGAVAKQDVDNARARLQAAEAEVKIRQKALDDATILAPFSGTVSWVFKEAFEDVREKEPVVRVVDTSRIEFVVNLPETLISRLPNVTNIRVVFDAFPNVEIPAEIKEVATEASETTRTYAVNLIMDQPKDVRVLPGMAGKATGDSKPASGDAVQSIFVPVSSVFSHAGDQTYVWVIDEETKTVKQRAVKTGSPTSTGIPVEEGLEAGEWIAIAGVNYLVEGQKVRIMDEVGI